MRIVAAILIMAGIGLAVYNFSTLNSFEFGPAGYLCPAHTCTLDEVWQAGYGGYVEAAAAGLAMLVGGMLILAGSLFLHSVQKMV